MRLNWFKRGFRMAEQRFTPTDKSSEMVRQILKETAQSAKTNEVRKAIKVHSDRKAPKAGSRVKD